MPILRQPSATTPTGTNWIDILVDELYYPADSYFQITIYCLNSSYSQVSSQSANGAGGGSGYRTPTKTFTGLNAGSTYYFYSNIRYQSGNATTRVPASGYFSVTTLPATPSTPTITSTSITDKTFRFDISTGANTTGVQMETSYQTNYIQQGASSNSSITMYAVAPAYGTQYSFRVRAYNSTYFSNWTSYRYLTATDTTPPIISFASFDASSYIYVRWTASDNNELRSSNRFAVAISTNGGTSYIHQTYTDDYTYYFYNDGNNIPLVGGGTYRIRITAYDSANNQTSIYRDNIVIPRVRPSNFSWSTTKTSGGNMNLTALEWNNLIRTINQFRVYKGYAVYSFTTAYSGDDITASIFNEALIAVRGLGNTVTPPANVSSGQTINASTLNLLVQSLNSIA